MTGWNCPAFATNGAGGPLACPAARHGRELLDRCHDDVLYFVNRALPPGVSEPARNAESLSRRRRGDRAKSGLARFFCQLILARLCSGERDIIDGRIEQRKLAD